MCSTCIFFVLCCSNPKDQPNMFSPVDISASSDHSNPPKQHVHKNIMEYLLCSHHFSYFSIAATWDFPSFPSLAIWPKSPVRTCGWFWCMHPSGIARCRVCAQDFVLAGRWNLYSTIHLSSISIYIYTYIYIFLYMYVRTDCIYI